MFIFLDTDLQDRPAAVDGRDRPRQGGAARPARCATSATRLASMLGRRLRQLLQPCRPLLQGDPAGAAARAPERRSSSRNYYITHARAATSVPLSTVAHLETVRGAAVAEPLPAAQLGDHLRRADAGRHARARRWTTCKDLAQQHAAAGLQRRLRRPVAPVRAGIERAGRDVLLRADHHLPRARGAVRELPRPAHHPGDACRCRSAAR